MKIKAIKNFRHNTDLGRKLFEEGKEYEVDKQTYEFAIKNKCAEKVKDKKEEKAIEKEEIENKAIEEVSENKGFFGKKKKKKVKPVIKKKENGDK
jgi:hypothetical protein